jgi:N6-adenosine-specific RNA methylase IME4
MISNGSIIPVKGNEIQLTPDSAFILDSEIKEFRKKINTNFWDLVKKLKVARDGRIWAVLDYDTWESYLAQPEIDLNNRTFDDYIYLLNNSEDYIKNTGQPVDLLQLDPSKLKVIIPHLTPENAEELINKAKTLSRSDLRKEVYEEKFKSLPKPEIPTGKYEVIVIDPPWPYGTVYDPETRRVANPYPEMSLEEIQNLPIPSADNCVMWLWTTHKFLPESFKLLESWGFDYKLTMVWDKQKMGMGYWLRCQAEFCVLGIKGKPAWYLENERDIISIARREHSRKPDEFYSMVERLNPNTKKIDFFSRQKREGWEQYGNESDKF